jgi:hypothetical protein
VTEREGDRGREREGAGEREREDHKARGDYASAIRNSVTHLSQ